MYCATNDGVFNFYNMVFGKKNEKIYPSFDRTYNLIHKIYCDQQRVISISKLRLVKFISYNQTQNYSIFRYYFSLYFFFNCLGLNGILISKMLICLVLELKMKDRIS